MNPAVAHRARRGYRPFRPAAMAAIALLLHNYVPNHQPALRTELFPSLLKLLLLFSTLLAAVAFFGAPCAAGSGIMHPCSQAPFCFSQPGT